jgi:hypothetical protein
MATLQEDLELLADLTDTHGLDAVPPTAKVSAELQKINWQRLICFAIPIYNLIAPMSGLPPMPVPAFCTTSETHAPAPA